MRIFLSYNTADKDEAFRLKYAIEVKDPNIRFFFAPHSLHGGVFWVPQLGQEIAEADAFLLLLSPSGVGAWQTLEYYEALDRRARDPKFAIVPVITAPAAPGLPFLRQLHWIAASLPYIDPHPNAIISALRGAPLAEIGEPWRTINPYRGLLALQEENAAYFFGRNSKLSETLHLIETRPGKLFALIGNSGVGKSSLVYAGIFDALKRQRWPNDEGAKRKSWPIPLQTSRRWAYLSARPGENPIRAIAGAFIEYWFEDYGDPKRHEWMDGWESRLSNKGRISELIDDTQSRCNDKRASAPERIVLYLDQAEELYSSRLPVSLKERFSELIVAALEDRRLVVIASQRSDYYGHLQADSVLFPKTERIDVPPLDASDLRAVLSEPARLLNAHFESKDLITILIDAARNQPGALPLLADHMTDLWARMQARGDGIVRVTDRSELIQVSSALAKRADLFLAQNASHIAEIRRLFCLKLTHVPREGEPVRRRIPRSECTDIEWNLIERLSAAEWRLLVTGEADNRAHAEVAHEVLLREWPTLKQWLLDEREFLTWRGEIEHARRQSDLVPKRHRASTLLMGRGLAQAENWLARRSEDIDSPEQAFIRNSLRRRQQIGQRLALLLALIFVIIFALPIAVLYVSQFRAGLLEARIQSMRVQGEIVAAAIAAQASVDTNTITISPERLLDLPPRESHASAGEDISIIDFSINPERVGPLLQRLVTPTMTRARVYDREGSLVADTRLFDRSGDVLRADLPPVDIQRPGFFERAWIVLRTWLGRGDLPLYRELANGTGYPEVALALSGGNASTVRANDRGEVIVSVAVPVKRLNAVRGALLFSTQRGDIDQMVEAERVAIFKVYIGPSLLVLLISWLVFRLIRGVIGRSGQKTFG